MIQFSSFRWFVPLIDTRVDEWFLDDGYAPWNVKGYFLIKLKNFLISTEEIEFKRECGGYWRNDATDSSLSLALQHRSLRLVSFKLPRRLHASIFPWISLKLFLTVVKAFLVSHRSIVVGNQSNRKDFSFHEPLEGNSGFPCYLLNRDYRCKIVFFPYFIHRDSWRAFEALRTRERERRKRW